MTDAPWQPRMVTMHGQEGNIVTAAYYPHEVLEMERDRAAGMPAGEIRFLHELKSTFDAILWKEAPQRRGMMPQWDPRRNTSAVRIVARADDYLAALEAREDDRQALGESAAAPALPVQESLL